MDFFPGENQEAQLISKIFALALCNGELIEFISSDEVSISVTLKFVNNFQLSTLPSRIVEACVTTFTDNHVNFFNLIVQSKAFQDIQRTLQLAACLNLPSLLDTVDVNAIDEEVCSQIS